METVSPRSPMTEQAAQIIDDAFEAWFTAFRVLSAHHARHFARQDWKQGAEEDRLRLGLYERHVQSALARARDLLGTEVADRERWAQVRGHYTTLRADRPNVELAETFYNSITRRVFNTVGTDPYIEFVKEALTEPRTMEAHPVADTYEPDGPTVELIEEILRSFDLDAPWQNLRRDAKRVAEIVDRSVTAAGGRLGRLDMLRPVFYRNKGAYLIGRIRIGEVFLPLILPVLHAPDGGLYVDAVLISANEASQVFSFTRSYFHVEYDQPWALVRFLKSLMPFKRIAELYLSLGFVKHGKTELYRDLSAFLDSTADKFVLARGTPGMVMSVFTLPGYDIVFKIIKDRFDPVKTVTRQEVRQKYRFVMMHDRVGRLADVQEFEHLEFPLHRFDERLLHHLLEECAGTVRTEGDCVVIEHLYTERRVTPLNLYLLEVSEAKARDAVVDAGYAIKDLAAANIFPGDMLVKNFGVTRHGRVIFYDYDELDHLTAFTFREKPAARSEFELMSDEAWFYVGPADVFPEEIGQFMGFPAACAEIFREYHADLLTVEFWTAMQARQTDDEPIDLFPYPPEKRLPLEAAA
jgi:isocitrate dehydrogenase kinase/phosphatase